MCHTFQTDTLLFGHPLYGNTSHHRDDVGNLFGTYDLSFLAIAFFPAIVQDLQLCFQHGLAVTIARSELEVLVLDGKLFLLLHELDLLLLLGDLGWNLGITQVDT